MPKEDGAVVIKTTLDNKKALTELNRLGKKIDTLNERLNEKKGQQSAIEAELKAATDEALKTTDRISELKAELESVKQVTDIANTDIINDPARVLEALQREKEITSELAEQEKLLKQQDKDAERLANQYAKITDSVNKAEEELESAEISAGELTKQLTDSGNEGSKAGERISASMEAAQKRLEKFEKRIVGLAKRVFVFTLISKALRSLKDYLWENIQTSAEAQAAIAKLRGALLTLAQPLVNVVIPAFTKLVELLSKLASVIANIISKIFGQTIETTVSQAEASREARNALKGETKALKGSAKAAKEAEKQLAGFDEIQQLTSNNAEDVTDALDIDFGEIENVPDYSDVFEMGEWIDDLLSSIQDKFGDFLSSLKLSFDDVILDWHDLTGEQIAEKIIAGLTALAGAVIGFSIGGVPGAIVGAFAGCALGLVFDSLLFDHDGQLSAEEILKMIITAAGALAGGIIGFSLGGVKGAAIGVLVGAALGVTLSNMIFDSDGKISREEVMKMIIIAAGALVGGILGFATGGPAGAAIGVLLGGYLGISISNLIFDGDGKVSQEEIAKMIVTAAGAIAGGIIGFVAGGPAGALIGVMVGASLGVTLSNLIFDSDGKVSGEEIIKMIVSAASAIAGGVLGFAAGGPAGAALGVLIGAGLGISLNGIIFDNDGKLSGNEIVKALLSALAVIAGGVIGFALGGPFGAIVGMALGVGLTFALSGIDWSAVEKAFSDLVNGVKEAWGNITKFLAVTWKIILVGVRTAWDGIWSIIKGVINMILGGVETFINGIIRTINLLLGAISSVASIFGELLGFGSVDLRIPEAHIPRLAAGAVIPPNREFLAVLGDQSSGNNIEAPEALLRQMAQEAASANTELLREILQAIRAGQTIEVDRMPFGRVVRDAYDRESVRTGASFVRVT